MHVKFKLTVLLFCFFVLSNAVIGQPPELPTYEDHANLLVIKTESSDVRPIKSAADWSVRRAHIISGFERVAGRLPGGERRVPLDLMRSEPIDEGSYTRCHITPMALNLATGQRPGY
jgi:hypothetical protein